MRGEGGRELVANTLRRRGAEVRYAEVYRRVRPEVDISTYLGRWRREPIDVVMVSSGESLRNLIAMLGSDGMALLKETPLAVVSARIAEQAHCYGFTNVLLADGASDQALWNAAKNI